MQRLNNIYSIILISIKMGVFHIQKPKKLLLLMFIRTI